MFRHICTTNLSLDVNSTSTIHEEPSIAQLLEEWSVTFNTQSSKYGICLFNLSDILSWESTENKLRLDQFLNLLKSGRATNQLVILQMENVEQLNEIKDSSLHNVITANTKIFDSVRI